MLDIEQPAVVRKRIVRAPKLSKSIFKNGHKMRKVIRYGFLAICILIGIQFYFWYHYYVSGGNAIEISRPGGAEGFLPLSALIGLKYWIFTGIFNHVHPAALVIFLAILIVSFIFKKSFCSFICPVGTISEWLWKLGRRLFGKKFIAPYGWRPPKWIDYPLRSLKYIMLAFFVDVILIKMNTTALKNFIDSPYNKVADLKMLLFFVRMSGLTLVVLLILAVASVFISNFWCRYLCPYGALLGIVSFFSPVKIRRNASTCTYCKACTRVCPAMIRVHKAGTVFSDECTMCLECVKTCPVADTLYSAVTGTRKKLSPRAVAISILALFLVIYLGGRLTGHWNSNITKQEYMYHIKHIDEYDHLR
jgi:polyferredoxin